MHFGSPAMLSALLVVPLIGGLLIWGAWRRRRAETRFAGSGLALLRSGRVSPFRRGLKATLLLAVAALIATALARPQLGERHTLLPREGSDVIIALDVSRSMSVDDVKPTRLDLAKRDADMLLTHLGGDRAGLVVFGGSAELRFPLTTDFTAARQVIDSVAIKDSGVKPGTDMSAALTVANNAFIADKTRGKVVILISDGEDLSGSDLQTVATLTKNGVIVHTVGVGTTAGGQVFSVDPRTNQATPLIDPATGGPAVSHRDDGNLRQLASAGHGTAYDGNTPDFAFDLSTVIGRLQKTRFESGNATIRIERFQIPLAIALVLLVLESLIPDSSRRRARMAAPSRLSPRDDPAETATLRRLGER